MQAVMNFFWGASLPPPTLKEQLEAYVGSNQSPHDFMTRIESGGEAPADNLMSLFSDLQKRANRKSNERLKSLFKAVKARLITTHKLSPTLCKIRKGITAKPQDMLLHLRLGNYLKETNPKKGIVQDDFGVKEHLEYVFSAQGGDPLVLASYGDYLRVKNPAIAADVLKLAALKTKDHTLPLENKHYLLSFIYACRANLALCQKNQPDAVRYLDTALECRPRHPFVEEVLGIFNQRQIAVRQISISQTDSIKKNSVDYLIPAHYPATAPTD